MTHHPRKKTEQTILASILVGVWTIIAGILKLIFKGFGKKKGLSVQVRNHITAKLDEITVMLQSDNVHELRQAVHEADKLVGYVLKNIGYDGETFAERLRFARADIQPNIYEAIWQGHKVRNQLAHESESRVDRDELKTAANKLLRYIGSI